MSDQTSIFENNNTGATAPNNTSGTSNTANVPSNSDLTDLLGQIKNERGEPKYKTVEDALKGLMHAQNYIPDIKSQLEQRDQELERLRKETERMRTLEETVAALTSKQTQAEPTTQPVIDEKVIADLINQQLTQAEKAKQAHQNVTSVVTTLQSVFGADAETKYNAAADAAGLTVQELNALAARSPKAVLSLLGVNQQSVSAPNINKQNAPGSINTVGFTPTQESYIGRNKVELPVGATSQELREAFERAKKMQEELHSQGKTINDLTNPSVYFKTFK